ncbi:MAG: CBS domain-containing protein [Gammaproteobacteria bacterium]|nr:CBS domain-containing protein [Gammaproteobacteria bacterium]MBU6510209.1 CBS domain-containing protein [Gammaproteobacteria bacterium]MDE1983158.1 CBS domain-containing protein [Gammaproteobacteria bacterium]MDE2108044.1 CBS domain-containing protein [Gammaproteobacteria bacterium]MDE2461021.1 CBS domain-containing protein [Gammaproteobacteria bacterium]
MSTPVSDNHNRQFGAGLRPWFERLRSALAGEPRDREELLELLQDAQARDLFDADAQAMLEGVLQVADMHARDIMIPRAQMVVLEKDAELRAALGTVVESGHSRFPVVGESRDEVVGIVLAKDLLEHFLEDPEGPFNLRDYLRPAPFVPESMRLNVLLKNFRASRSHMAIVADEYGGAAGLVTIEDVLEQIVGDIDDEYDVDDEARILKHSDKRYTVKALTPIGDFNEYFGTTFGDADYATVGGLVTHAFGHLPKRGEKILIGKLRFKVLRADSRRLHLLEVLRKDTAATSPEITQ